MQPNGHHRNCGLLANGNSLRPPLRRKDYVWQYLESREKLLRLIHPQWDFAESQTRESTSWSKRQGSPICIPPSWDVVKKYAGAVDSTAAGFDSDFYKYGERFYSGDHGEAAFLALAQQSAIGGLLIGNIDSRHMLRGSHESCKVSQEYALPTPLMKIVEDVLQTSKSTDQMPATRQSDIEPEENCRSRRNTNCSEQDETETHCCNNDDADAPASVNCRRFFEFDFVLLHPTFGIYQIEVKSTKCKNRAKALLKTGFKQLDSGKLQRLFTNFCKLLFEDQDSDALWKKFNAHGAVVFAPSTNQENEPLVAGEGYDSKLQQYPQFDCYHNEIHSLEAKIKSEIRATNFFDHEVFRYFAVFLSCFRPNFFISPALCAIRTRDNILTMRVNTTRFYEAKYEGATEMRFDLYMMKSLEAGKKIGDELCKVITQECVQKIVHEVHDILAHAESELSQNSVDALKIAHRLADEGRKEHSQLSGVVRQQIAATLNSVLTKDCLSQLLQPLKKKVSQGRLNSLQNEAQSIHKYLGKLKHKKGLIKHADIFFHDGRTDIYFTKEQLNAIDIFDSFGQPYNQRQLIMGPPGSGKSIILMVKLFILKQIRPEMRLAYASWFKHDYVVKEFLRRNKCKCCRKVEFFSEHGIAKRLLGKDRPMVRFDNASKGKVVEDKRFNETEKMRAILDSEFYDVVLDERHVLNHLGRFMKTETKFHNNFSIGVLTGGYKLHSLCRETAAESTFNEVPLTNQLIEPIRLSTVFRSTNRIRKYVDALMERETISGHSFDGVPIEEWRFETEAAAFQAASEHVMKLNTLLGKFVGTRQIALIAEEPQRFTAFLAYGSCLPHTELPQCANDVPSLEFPVVVVICSRGSAKQFLPISASRAICHLIVFMYERPSGS